MWQSACFEDHLDHWTENNTGAYYPKPYFGGIQKNQQTLTRYLQSYRLSPLQEYPVGVYFAEISAVTGGISNCRILSVMR